MISLKQLVVIFCMVTTTAMQETTTEISLNPTVNRTETNGNNCTTKNNKQGVCVDPSACNEDHTIQPGGDLDPMSEFRAKPGKNCGEELWCCTEPIPPPEINSTSSGKCLAPESDVCPWCVLLYKAVDEKKLARARRPFCLGALIGSRVIITASTCLKGAQKMLLYAQVPNSADPAKKYIVNRRVYHPHYNSGTHEFDFGIMVIDNDVTFEKEKSRGACIDFDVFSSKPSEDRCVVYGFDNKGKITSTIMAVSNRSCGKSGSSKDAACGENLDEVCIVAAGGPVICQSKKDQGLYLVGVARSSCDTDDKATLGNIALSKKWIEEEFAAMTINKDLYT